MGVAELLLRLGCTLTGWLLLFALRTPWATLFEVNAGGSALCNSTAAWTVVWSPLQLLVVVTLAIAAGILWLRAGRVGLSAPRSDAIQRQRLGEE